VRGIVEKEMFACVYDSLCSSAMPRRVEHEVDRCSKEDLKWAGRQAEMDTLKAKVRKLEELLPERQDSAH